MMSPAGCCSYVVCALNTRKSVCKEERRDKYVFILLLFAIERYNLTVICMYVLCYPSGRSTRPLFSPRSCPQHDPDVGLLSMQGC